MGWGVVRWKIINKVVETFLDTVEGRKRWFVFSSPHMTVIFHFRSKLTFIRTEHGRWNSLRNRPFFSASSAMDHVCECYLWSEVKLGIKRCFEQEDSSDVQSFFVTGDNIGSVWVLNYWKLQATVFHSYWSVARWDFSCQALNIFILGDAPISSALLMIWVSSWEALLI